MKMSETEKKEWIELYEYVKKEIFHYDDEQGLPQYIVLRIKGLRTGKHIESNKIYSLSNYPFSVILATFKICKPQIDRCLRTILFEDETHKANYILKIVSNNLNDVYVRLKKNEENKEKIGKTEVIVNSTDSADYQKKTKETPKRLDDLW